MNVLLTGFGPFPGMPSNPTQLLVERLVRRRRALGRRSGHVFPTRYDAVDRDLPRLLRRDRPDVLVMFGVAESTPHVRIETVARNVLNRMLPDAGGHLPRRDAIAEGAATAVPLRAAAPALVRAARAAGVDARPSDDAGTYLCNYLCWRATEAASRPGGPKLAAFVHVPDIRGSASGRPPLTLGQLLHAGDAIISAAVCAVRTMR
jgi:pyroglutamyl-peptidase